MDRIILRIGYLWMRLPWQCWTWLPDRFRRRWAEAWVRDYMAHR